MTSAARALPALALFAFLTSCGAFDAPLVAPVIVVVNGATVPAGPPGSMVTINGAVFGDVQGNGQVVFTPSGGGVPRFAVIQSAVNWSDGTIVTTVPDSATPGTYGVAVLSGNGLTSNAYTFAVTPAIFKPSTLAWTGATSLPAAQSGTAVTSVKIGNNTYVYAIGGARAGGTPTNAVYYASVSAGGTIGAWTATTSLPAPLAYSAATTATTYNTSITAGAFMYLVGGTTDAAGTPVNTVQRATVNGDGTLGAWATVATLPTALRSAGAIVWYGSLYVVGGARAGNVPVSTVYRSPIQVNGSVSLNLQAASLPGPRSRFGFGASGLNLYVIGGDSGAVTPNDSTPGAKQTATIFIGKLVSNTHDVATWISSTPLPAPRSAHTAVLQSNFALVTGGLYGGGAAEEIYAPLSVVDGGVGTFTTAPAPSTIGRKLFNHGASGYLAGDGTFHVLVAGGDDAGAPSVRRAESFRY